MKHDSNSLKSAYEKRLHFFCYEYDIHNKKKMKSNKKNKLHTK